MAETKTRLAIFRETLGINQTELSKKIGIHQRNWSRYESGDVSPPEDVLLKLASLGLNLHWLHTGDGEMMSENNKQTSLPFAMQFFPTKKQTSLPIKNEAFGDMPIIEGDVPRGLVIPILDQAVSAGYGKGLEDEGFPDRFITVPRDLARFKALKALPVQGDSMSPTLHEGDLVVCDSGGWSGDGIYVIKTQESAYVKRVVLTSKGYTVISDNKAYPTYSESKEDVDIVGKVRCAVVRLK